MLRTLSDLNIVHRSIRIDPGDLHSDPQATMIVSAAVAQSAIINHHSMFRRRHQYSNHNNSSPFEVSNRLTGDIGYVGAVKQAQFLKGRSVLGTT